MRVAAALRAIQGNAPGPETNVPELEVPGGRRSRGRARRVQSMLTDGYSEVEHRGAIRRFESDFRRFLTEQRSRASACRSDAADRRVPPHTHSSCSHPPPATPRAGRQCRRRRRALVAFYAPRRGHVRAQRPRARAPVRPIAALGGGFHWRILLHRRNGRHAPVRGGLRLQQHRQHRRCGAGRRFGRAALAPGAGWLIRWCGCKAAWMRARALAG